MVKRKLTYSEINWKYIVIGWDIADFFPKDGKEIIIKIKNKMIKTKINKRKRIKSKLLFELLKPKLNDVLVIIKKDGLYHFSIEEGQ